MAGMIIEATVEHYVSGQPHTEIVKLSESYDTSIDVTAYREKFENVTFQRFQSKWADTIELTVTQENPISNTNAGLQTEVNGVGLRTVLYPR